MIESFRNKALERFWWKGKAKGLLADHIPRLTELLSALDAATALNDMNLPGYDFHRLRGDEKGRFAVKVNKNWRVTFGWSDDGPAAVDVDYLNYH